MRKFDVSISAHIPQQQDIGFANKRACYGVWGFSLAENALCGGRGRVTGRHRLSHSSINRPYSFLFFQRF
jgi:hypothetical protein